MWKHLTYAALSIFGLSASAFADTAEYVCEDGSTVSDLAYCPPSNLIVCPAWPDDAGPDYEDIYILVTGLTDAPLPIGISRIKYPSGGPSQIIGLRTSFPIGTDGVFRAEYRDNELRETVMVLTDTGISDEVKGVYNVTEEKSGFVLEAEQGDRAKFYSCLLDEVNQYFAIEKPSFDLHVTCGDLVDGL